MEHNYGTLLQLGKRTSRNFFKMQGKLILKNRANW